MIPRNKTRLALLALAGIALILFATTVDLLPHRHKGDSERVCPICHPPLLGPGRVALRLPSLSGATWIVAPFLLLPVRAASVRLTAPRAPPFI